MDALTQVGKPGWSSSSRCRFRSLPSSRGWLRPSQAWAAASFRVPSSPAIGAVCVTNGPAHGVTLDLDTTTTFQGIPDGGGGRGPLFERSRTTTTQTTLAREDLGGAGFCKATASALPTGHWSLSAPFDRLAWIHTMANYVVAANQRVSAQSPSRRGGRAAAGHLQGIPAAPEGWQLIPGRCAGVATDRAKGSN